MLTITATDDWNRVHSGAHIGLLELSGISNAGPCPLLEERKRAAEATLRARYGQFARRDFLAQPVMAAYAAYYRRFGKTYHVQLQLESIVLKGKNLPAVSPAVDANFMAEVETFVLAAGHDVSCLRGPVLMDASRAGDRMVLMNGSLKDLRPDDMIMRDADAVRCSIIYGQDERSPIVPQTAHVLYVAYAPAGVPGEQVELHLRRIEENLRLCSPDALLEQCRLLSAPAAFTS